MDTVRSSDGTVIAFDRSGEGPPVILVGGAFQDRAIDEPTAQLPEYDNSLLAHADRGRIGSEKHRKRAGIVGGSGVLVDGFGRGM